MNNILIICGPTSSGKTSLSLKICEKFNGEIISADSRQIYKYMDIGTGKVPINSDIKIKKHNNYWEFNGVKIWGYDLVKPDEYYSAYDFALFALNKTRELIEKGKKVFLTGGTGFYIDLFTGRKKPARIQPDFKLRKELEKLSLEELQEQLTSLNLDEYNRIDDNNPIRLIRAIEKEISDFPMTPPLPYLDNSNFYYVGLNGPRDFLYHKADLWLENVWKNGLLQEVRKLIKMGFLNSRKLRGLIYSTVLDYFDNKLAEEDAIQRAKFDIHHYIRRQLTWFRKNKHIKWFDINEDDFEEKVCNNINVWINKS